MAFATAVIWREPIAHIKDYYFFMTKIKWLSAKLKHEIVSDNYELWESSSEINQEPHLMTPEELNDIVTNCSSQTQTEFLVIKK